MVRMSRIPVLHVWSLVKIFVKLRDLSPGNRYSWQAMSYTNFIWYPYYVISYTDINSTPKSEIITARKCNIIQTILVSGNPYSSDKLYALRPNVGYETLDHKLGLNCISLRLQERKRYGCYDHLKCMVAAAWSGCCQFMGRIGLRYQTESVLWIWGVQVPGCNRIIKCCCFIVKNI